MTQILNHSLQMPIKSAQLISLILLFFVIVNSSQAQDASFDGRVLKLPAIIWHGVVYSAEMTWMENSEPVTFEVTSVEATDLDPQTEWVQSFWWFYLLVPLNYEGIQYDLSFLPKGILDPEYGPTSRERTETTVFWELNSVTID